ncbi:DUF4405 domain-containing protein [Frigidibacter sp. MR17.14]|uniref:DUF4405 domain-containing protein n=1 Tax=Frigidibacter sp. MR17.14 TaxID=3126509 RepID=UPI0030129CE6
MRAFLFRYATPATLTFFLVSLITGIGLFFHIGPSGFRGSHEWLSLVLIAPFLAHLWRNWRPMLSYLRGPRLWITAAVTLVAMVPFFLPAQGTGGGRSGPPQFALAHRLMAAPLQDAAPALGLTPEALGTALAAAGYAPEPGASLSAIAAAAGKDEAALAALLVTIEG